MGVTACGHGFAAAQTSAESLTSMLPRVGLTVKLRARLSPNGRLPGRGAQAAGLHRATATKHCVLA